MAEALKLLAAALPAAAAAGGEPAQAAIASVLAPLLVRCMRSLALPMQQAACRSASYVQLALVALPCGS